MTLQSQAANATARSGKVADQKFLTLIPKDGKGKPVWSREMLDVIKDQCAKGATDAELAAFLHVAHRSGLDPMLKQIHFIRRKNSEGGYTGAIQIGIDGFRLQAERTGKYEGQTLPQWCGEDGEWKEIWISKEHPFAAKVGVYKAGFRDPLFGIARWDAYVQQTFIYNKGVKTEEARLNAMWARMGIEQLAKCAEALAIRKAFPQECSRLYERSEVEVIVGDEGGKIIDVHSENEPVQAVSAKTDSFADTSEQKDAPVVGTVPATEIQYQKMAKMIFGAASRVKVDREKLIAWTHKNFEVDSFKKLTMIQLASVYDILNTGPADKLKWGVFMSDLAKS